MKNLILNICNDFSTDYNFIFPLFDEHAVLIHPYIRSVLINDLYSKVIQHFEIYHFYDNLVYYGIFNFIKPVKKCVNKYCVVLVPSKIEYSIDGCSSVYYAIYNGEKFINLPQLVLTGDFDETSEHYYENLRAARENGVQRSELFGEEFKKTDVFKTLINISNDEEVHKNVNCIIWLFDSKKKLYVNETLNENYLNAFERKYECHEEKKLNEELYKDYILVDEELNDN